MNKKGVLPPKVREEIESLLNQGILDSKEILIRLEAMGYKNIGGQQVGGLLTLHKRRMSGDLSADFRRAADSVLNPDATPEPASEAPRVSFPADGFNWSAGAGNGTGPGGFSFGQVRVEYHIWRVAPTNDGFLGVEPEGFTLSTLGQKYGSGTYDIALYVNDKRAKTVREIMAKTYGDPKTPRSGGPAPRLVHEDEKRKESQSAGELSEAVRAVRDIHDMVKQQEVPKSGLEGKVVDRAFEVLTAKPASAPQDSLVAMLQAQQLKADTDRAAERDRWERDQKAAQARVEDERKDREARDDRERKDAEAKHTREMDRMKAEFDLRQKEAERVAIDKDKRDEEYRKFVHGLEKDREKRLEEAILATNQSIEGLQAAHAADLEKERNHQAELARIREDQLKLDRERMVEESKLNREHMNQLYDLQLKAIPNTNGNTEKMICETIKDIVVRADAKFTETLDVKKMQELIKLVGPENAQQLAASYMMNGGIDMKKIFGQKLATAPPAAEPAPAGAPAAAPPVASAMKGEGMNSILQTVFETPFFMDLIDVWAGHLKHKRSPYLFAHQMAEYMVEDRRVTSFYNYMAARTWQEFFEEIKGKIPAAKLPFFEAPEAEKHFDQVIELIAKRIEADHVVRGIVPSSVETVPAPQEAAEK